MSNATMIIGIHGLANKPPIDEKQKWWRLALIEGLKRNCGKTNDELAFDFLYWADLRYRAPVSDVENSQPYQPDGGTGPLPAYRSHKWTEIINVAQKIMGAEIDFVELH